MTARKFVLKPYAERMSEREKQRARYLRKLSAPLCKVCYGLDRCKPCPVCDQKKRPTS